ncbi:zinc-dependent alcohol dehydrogenase family protein [Gluconacetobacter sacchari]|uniref:Alcohol dehydrogenase catalytic domain-containing protein n=2 Tax=Gluconacetobacter sacchari TaxID=92759 RepID=A0A7W4IAM4_9PROT|nr:zinc-dependent alcohol dehydrogenase family protein [Gluconacetobacter sacchari]MBB2159289.1 alcohol dehydrogenase catalytic domain-containing protein [Gluconacetobacter sacchari]GBQ26766.1 alcohol dehydrogenase [Gluconacetobacter sacchari DSM 12717]
MKIRAALLREMGKPAPYARSRPLSIETLDLAPPGPGEVLVRIMAAGLCHSDLSVIDASRPRPMPMVLGHEAAGMVAELGAGVTGFAVGDHVVMTFTPSCGRCPTCAGGRPAMCEPGGAANTAGTLIDGATRLSLDGRPVHHHLGVSGFADHAVVSPDSLVRIPADLPFAEAALFGCAVMTGVGAVVNTARIEAGTTVAVVGLGGVGLAAIMGARAAGAREVIAVDLSDAKLALAQQVGATAGVNAGAPDAVDQVRRRSAGGVDYAFEMAGSIRALDSAVAMTRRAGGMTVTAGLPPHGASLPLDIARLVGEERSLRGSYMGTCVPSRDIPRYIALYQAGRLPVDRLLTGRLGLDAINEGFDRLRTAQAVRQVIDFPH